MRKIRVSIFSVQPVVISSLKNFFSNSSLIISNYITNLKSLQNLSNDIIVIDDGSLNNNQMFNITAGLSNISNIILFTAQANKGYFVPFLFNKIGGIVSKKAELHILEKAIVKVSEGGNYFCNYTEETLNNIDNIESNKSLLTRSECEVLDFMIKGYPNKKIANLLYVSVDAIYSHVHNIKKKLDIN